jgi:hypothetical protein
MHYIHNIVDHDGILFQCSHLLLRNLRKNPTPMHIRVVGISILEVVINREQTLASNRHRSYHRFLLYQDRLRPHSQDDREEPDDSHVTWHEDISVQN